MKFLIGLVAAAAFCAENPPAAAVPNRAPLQPNVFYALPLGAVKPAGWLRQQLRAEADVETQDAAAMLSLAAQLDDPALMEKARVRAKVLLEQIGEGPKPDRDVWSDLFAMKALTRLQETTGDERVFPALTKYFAAQAAQLDSAPLRDTAHYRWGDELQTIVWLYNRTGNAALLDLAKRVSAQGFDWKALYSDDYPFKEKVAADAVKPEAEGVNNAAALKTGALWALVSGDAADRAVSAKMVETLDRYHGLPNGAFTANKHLGGREPSEPTSLCTVVEQMASLEQLVALTGDEHLAQRLERLAYNALAGAFTRDMTAHQPAERLNQITIASAARNAFAPDAPGSACTADIHQGWPNFTASLWMGTADNGLAAVNYGPSDVRAMVNGAPVHVTEETLYPFSEEIVMNIEADRPAAFPLRLRIPGWTSGVVIRVNGAAQRDVKPGSFFTISREWKTGDRILIRMPMPVMVSHAPRKAVFVSRGPLVYSLAIGEKWKKLPDSQWEVAATTPWSYALQVDKNDPQSSFSVEVRAMKGLPFTRDGTPVEIHARGGQVRDWPVLDGAPAPVPEGSSKVARSVENLTLIPFAAAKLRITEFPEFPK